MKKKGGVFLTEYLITLLSDMSLTMKYVMTACISMLPIVEIRGAVPVGTALNLNTYWLLIIAVLGNLLPIPFVVVFARRIIFTLKRFRLFSRFAAYFENKAAKNADKILNYEKIGLFLFVAIPLPGTGAWTGAIIASLLNLRLKNCMPPIICGVVTAGIIMTLGSKAIEYLIHFI